MKNFFLIFILILFIFPASSFGQNLNLENAKKKKLQEEISYIDKQLSTTKSSHKESINTLVLTHKKINTKKALLDEISNEISQYNIGIYKKNKEIQQLTNRLDTLKKYYEKMVYNAYKNRDPKLLFMFIFSSENLGQSIRRWSYLQNISEQVHTQAKEIKSTSEKLTEAQKTLISYKNQLEQNRISYTKEYRLYIIERDQINKKINSLRKKENDYLATLKQKRQEVEELNKKIEQLLSAAVAKEKMSKKGQTKDQIKIDYKLSSNFANNKGKLPWPVSQGVITEHFGQHYHPIFKSVKLPYNNGINITTDKNASVFCIFKGVVKQILVMPGYNQCILIQHGEYFTFYTKLKRIYVKRDQNLDTGSPIGVVDDKEDHGELHFQLWKGTSKQNPEYWLKKK